MVVAAESLCMGCMDLKRSGLCPNPDTCGWTDAPERPSFPQLPPHTILQDRYILGRVLGQGGFGITYLGADLQDYRKLALKEYFPTSFATRNTDRRTVTYAGPGNREPYQYGLRKFEQEGITLQKFQGHANIVTVIRSFKANGTGYLVMEYLDGITLQDYLKRQPDGKISFEEALLLLTPIMDALREVHGAGITHRDISPDNIHVCKSGRIKLLDFGAARLALRDQTQSQQLILKPGYTPEEQYRSSGIAGPSTDIYSLAATMYKCITGVVPPEATERLSEDHLVPPGRVAKLPARAERALLKALAVRARDRFSTVDEFQRNLGGSRPAAKIAAEPAASNSRMLPVFLLWWLIASVFMVFGSVWRAGAGFGLFWIGLIPAGLALRAAVKTRREAPVNPDGNDPGLWVLFWIVSLSGILLISINLVGAALLALSALLARIVMARVALPEVKIQLPSLGLRCLNGELAGNTLEVAGAAIVIGRLADRANVVVPLPQISGAHTRLWRDAKTGLLWIEDLHSRNGTYVKKGGGAAGWVRIGGREALCEGDEFYLGGEDLAMFEVVRPASGGSATSNSRAATT